jgi:hypothetical protein
MIHKQNHIHGSSLQPLVDFDGSENPICNRLLSAAAANADEDVVAL